MRSNLSRPNLKLVESDYRGPSMRFLSLTRNPKLRSPVRFEPTAKRAGDVVI
jgi:hypothetical protein